MKVKSFPFVMGEKVGRSFVILGLAFITMQLGIFLSDVVVGSYDSFIEQKVHDRIEEEKEKMKGKVAYCDLLCTK